MGTGRGDVINMYIDFTLAGGETVGIQVECNSNALDNNSYKISNLVSGTITTISVNLGSTGKYVVPVSIPKDADVIYFVISGLTLSDLSINLGLDNYYA